MKKIWYLTVAIITLLFILSGCGNENAGKTNESTESRESAETEQESKKDNNSTEAKEPLNVQFDGSVTYKSHHLTVEGQTGWFICV
ncbi:hypothetical protein [Virgibacillus ihumii]|uniref:hypothetical protein n=1 Tax=Virgibacillus ihumii TaxID=2686091 RepID=UPI00157C7931|nr:hypothetical protein [Virgibacillus ihumii]